MKEMGATVSQANETNNPNITGAPHFEDVSHISSLLVQAYSYQFLMNYLLKLKSPF
jgi:hypothetical protein